MVPRTLNALLDLAVLRSHLRFNTSSADINVTKRVTEVYVFVNWIIQTSLNVSPWITANDTVTNSVTVQFHQTFLEQTLLHCQLHTFYFTIHSLSLNVQFSIAQFFFRFLTMYRGADKSLA